MKNLCKLRKAQPGDAADLAILDNIASHGLSQWFWQQAEGREAHHDPFEYGYSRMLDPNFESGFANATIAYLPDGTICDAATAYEMTESPAGEMFSNPVMQPLMELFSQCVDHFVLDSLAVYSRHQGQGVGRQLVANCFEQASAQNSGWFSLIVEDSNLPARKLYECFGLSITAQRHYIPFGSGSTSNYWLLMQKQINRK